MKSGNERLVSARFAVSVAQSPRSVPGEMGRADSLLRCVASLRRNQLRIPAASTDIGVLPVPMEPGVNLSIEAHYLPKIEKQTSHRR